MTLQEIQNKLWIGLTNAMLDLDESGEDARARGIKALESSDIVTIDIKREQFVFGDEPKAEYRAWGTVEEVPQGKTIVDAKGTKRTVKGAYINGEGILVIVLSISAVTVTMISQVCCAGHRMENGEPCGVKV